MLKDSDLEVVEGADGRSNTTIFGVGQTTDVHYPIYIIFTMFV